MNKQRLEGLSMACALLAMAASKKSLRIIYKRLAISYEQQAKQGE